MLGLMVFTTSVNYWRHPTQGARRVLGMCATTSHASAIWIRCVVCSVQLSVFPATRGCFVLTVFPNYFADMAVVAAAFLVHVRHSVYILDKMHGPLYWILCSVGIGCYLKSKACGAEQDYHGDSLFHMLLHIIGNISNVVLYLRERWSFFFANLFIQYRLSVIHVQSVQYCQCYFNQIKTIAPQWAT
jgi:hypothetical protein